MPLTLRSEKGSALTYDELDANFQGLANGAFLETTIAGTYEFDQVNASIGMNTPLFTGTTGNITTVNSTTVNADVVNAPGSIVQQKFAVKTSTSQTITSLTPVRITGLDVQITPKYADSIIEIQAYIATNAYYVSSFGIFKDGQKTVTTTDNKNESGMQSTIYHAGSIDTMWMFPVYHYEVAGNTNLRTYDVYATSGWNGTLYTMKINNRNSGDMHSLSYITVKEIRP